MRPEYISENTKTKKDFFYACTMKLAGGDLHGDHHKEEAHGADARENHACPLQWLAMGQRT